MRALVCGLVVLSLCGCKRSKVPPSERLRLERGKLLATYDGPVTAGARGPGKLFAIGTSSGSVIVDEGSRRVRMLRAIGNRPAATSQPTATSQPKVPPTHDAPIIALDFSPDGRYLLSLGGHFIIWWDLAEHRMVRQLRGPIDLTAAVFDNSGSSIFFANSHGHVYRWRQGKKAAEAVKGYFCRPTLVAPERRRLDPVKRCRVGHYNYVDDKPLCFYPVTQLVRRKHLLARACREGTVGLIDLRTRKIQWSNLAGHLGALAFVDDQQLLFARKDGLLRLWSATDRKIARQYQPAGQADAAASDGRLIAVAQGSRIRLWRVGEERVAGAVTVPKRVIWLQLESKPTALRALLADGRLIRHRIGP